ncbi:MAG: hypothetical protein J5504_06980 [Butyrivibrio sp.]|nr:hypothetical protein [Butyrivibrio sp.]
MAIKIVGKCSSCGADVKLDENQEKGYCQYCGAEYVVDNRGQSFSEAAFSYLNKAGKRHQENSKRRMDMLTQAGKQVLEVMEQRRIRKETERKRALIVGSVLLGAGVVISLIMAAVTEKGSNVSQNDGAQVAIIDAVEKQVDEESIKSEEVTANEVASDVQTRKDINRFSASLNSREHVGEFSFSVPLYFKADTVEPDMYRAYAETGEKVVMLLVQLLEDDEKVSEEWLDDAEDTRLFAESYLSSFEKANIVSEGKRSVGGRAGYKFDYTFEVKGIPSTGYSFIFPSIEDNCWVIAGLAESNYADYEYYGDFEKILASFTELTDVEETGEDSNVTAETEGIQPTYDKEYALRAFQVVLTNYYSADVFKADGYTVDKKKFHKYSDTSADFYFIVTSGGNWKLIDENTWEGTGICFKPNSGSGVVNNASCRVNFDGSNYVVSQMRGCYAIPGHEADVASFADIESESSTAVYLKVSPALVE